VEGVIGGGIKFIDDAGEVSSGPFDIFLFDDFRKAEFGKGPAVDVVVRGGADIAGDIEEGDEGVGPGEYEEASDAFYGGKFWNSIKMYYIWVNLY
jgi:hypothetical protein